MISKIKVQLFELFENSTKAFYEWLTLKMDGDEKRASMIYAAISLVVMQPFIIGIYYIKNKNRLE